MSARFLNLNPARRGLAEGRARVLTVTPAGLAGMKDSSFRERVVDVMEEYQKFLLIMREHADYLVDRYSERKEVTAKGRLLSQAEKEAEQAAAKELDLKKP